MNKVKNDSYIPPRAATRRRSSVYSKRREGRKRRAMEVRCDVLIFIQCWSIRGWNLSCDSLGIGNSIFHIFSLLFLSFHSRNLQLFMLGLARCVSVNSIEESTHSRASTQTAERRKINMKNSISIYISLSNPTFSLFRPLHFSWPWWNLLEKETLSQNINNEMLTHEDYQNVRSTSERILRRWNWLLTFPILSMETTLDAYSGN